MSTSSFSTSDLEQLKERGIPPEEANRQLVQLRQGKAFLPIERPCTISDGIMRLDDSAPFALCRIFAANRQRFTRFVPASGAASRMFQGLFPGELDSDKVARLRSDIRQFPFYADLAEAAGCPPEDLDDIKLFRTLLNPEGLGLAGKPKGLQPLHRGQNYDRTAFAEHLFESHRIGINNFHFTVSQDHLELFQQQLEEIKSELGGDTDIEVSFSMQSPQTDTIALDCQSDSPFHNEKGELLFRPAGHGALLENLEQCQGDLVLIRNIDNVVPKRLQEPYQFWNEILGGQLLATQQEVFSWVEKLESTSDSGTLHLAGKFLKEAFGLTVNSGSTSPEELLALLDRPIRICGMVPISGQPGGGPFWAKDASGQITLQIVEGVQIDPENPEQQKTLAASTHFNPVNIACSLRDRDGNPYRLADFVDEDASLITAKNHNGRDLLALERPGLWNGAMSGWNTIFIEMPSDTFNPIKTVFDLLQPTHQADL